MCDRRRRIALLCLTAAAVFSRAGGFSFQPFSSMPCCPMIQSSISQNHGVTSTILRMTTASDTHPAVEGWPEKYGRDLVDGADIGPRVLHDDFTVERASSDIMERLDVEHWPTWTTANNPKWIVGNQVVDKVMPYGELSYVISGKLEIIPASTGEPVVVEAGDFVTFPEGFKASWKVLEELTWYYYLY